MERDKIQELVGNVNRDRYSKKNAWDENYWQNWRKPFMDLLVRHCWEKQWLTLIIWLRGKKKWQNNNNPEYPRTQDAYHKGSYRCIMGIPEGRKKGTKAVFEVTVTKNFSQINVRD